MGYKTRTVRVDLSDLLDDPEGSFVEILNPGMLSTDQLGRLGLLSTLPDDAADEVKLAAGQQRLAALVKDWRVFDAETDELLGSPATAQLFARLPAVVSSRIAEALNEVSAPKS